MEHAYWGPGFGEAAGRAALEARRGDLGRQGCVVTRLEDERALCEWAAERIAGGKIVGWFQGRMEWGGRALGNRSILADPRRPDMRELINERIKFREFNENEPIVHRPEEALDCFLRTGMDALVVGNYAVEKGSEVEA